ncbi:MAG: NAD(P)-dependent oxidoreductase [Burkholderiales bacterium]|nr:NAD(P)-dependent oxidoreductase [Burkholderiales bacterium]
MRVAIVGASGYVGSTLVERLRARRDLEIVPCIHGSGNAGQVARLGIALAAIDLLDREVIARSLAGCTHVVNCSRGDNAVMLKGLANLLEACRRGGVRRFVHLSSVMVYGDPPAPDSTGEDGRTEPRRGTYGWVKLEQDRLVEKAAREGLSSVILCPPNITGALSGYVETIYRAMKERTLGLVDGGNTPCNVVDVRNLARAIELALERGPADGRRLFVTDDHATTWADMVEGLRSLPGAGVELPAIARDELARLAAGPPAPRASLGRALVHLASSDVRQALRKDPLWARVDAALRSGVRLLGRDLEAGMRIAVEGPVRVARASGAPALDVRLTAQQLRGVVHSCERAKRELGYAPPYSLQQSLAAFRRSYCALHGLDSPVGDLLRAL